jgi:protein phosphatase
MADIDFFQLTRGGLRRKTNDDAVGCWSHADGLVLAVADGLGEQSGGEVASHLALEVLSGELAQAPTSWPLTTRLRRAVQAANVAIYQKAITVPELQGMATTLTTTALVGSSLVTAHVGDCRLWLLRDGTLIQLTKDHTWVWAHLPGAPSVEQVRHQPRRYSLPRCLGRELIVSIDMLSLELRAGDVLAQCSDGVHGALTDDGIQELLEAHPPEAACHAILRCAGQLDGSDDLSVQVAAVRDVPLVARRWWPFSRVAERV